MALRHLDYKTRDSARGWSQLIVEVRSLSDDEVRGVFGRGCAPAAIRANIADILVRRSERFFGRMRRRFAARLRRIQGDHMDPSALLASAAKAASEAAAKPHVRALVERGATEALDRADEAAAGLGKAPRKVAQAALGELRARLPEIADLGRDGLVLVVARAAGAVPVVMSATLDEALAASAEQRQALVHERDVEVRVRETAFRVASAIGEAAAKVALGLIVGGAK